MYKKFTDDVKERMALVECRLTAINKEKESLDEEYDTLVTLSNLYKKRGNYDTIDTERRVTTTIINNMNGSKPLIQQNKNKGGKRIKGVSKYDEIFQTIYEQNSFKPMNIPELTKATNALLKTPVVAGTISNTVKMMLKDDRMIEVTPYRGKPMYIYGKQV